jgi:hypothetical protein
VKNPKKKKNKQTNKIIVFINSLGVMLYTIMSSPITITIHTHMKQMTQNTLNGASHSNQILFLQVFSVLIHILHLGVLGLDSCLL